MPGSNYKTQLKAALDKTGLPTEKKVKLAESYMYSDDGESLERSLRGIDVPDDIKAAIWDARSSEMSGQTPDFSAIQDKAYNAEIQALKTSPPPGTIPQKGVQVGMNAPGISEMRPATSKISEIIPIAAKKTRQALTQPITKSTGLTDTTLSEQYDNGIKWLGQTTNSPAGYRFTSQLIRAFPEIGDFMSSPVGLTALGATVAASGTAAAPVVAGGLAVAGVLAGAYALGDKIYNWVSEQRMPSAEEAADAIKDIAIIKASGSPIRESGAVDYANSLDKKARSSLSEAKSSAKNYFNPGKPTVKIRSIEESSPSVYKSSEAGNPTVKPPAKDISILDSLSSGKAEKSRGQIENETNQTKTSPPPVSVSEDQNSDFKPSTAREAAEAFINGRSPAQEALDLQESKIRLDLERKQRQKDLEDVFRPKIEAQERKLQRGRGEKPTVPETGISIEEQVLNDARENIARSLSDGSKGYSQFDPDSQSAIDSLAREGHGRVAYKPSGNAAPRTDNPNIKPTRTTPKVASQKQATASTAPPAVENTKTAPPPSVKPNTSPRPVENLQTAPTPKAKQKSAEKPKAETVNQKPPEPKTEIEKTAVANGGSLTEEVILDEFGKPLMERGTEAKEAPKTTTATANANQTIKPLNNYSDSYGSLDDTQNAFRVGGDTYITEHYKGTHKLFKVNKEHGAWEKVGEDTESSTPEEVVSRYISKGSTQAVPLSEKVTTPKAQGAEVVESKPTPAVTKEAPKEQKPAETAVRQTPPPPAGKAKAATASSAAGSGESGTAEVPKPAAAKEAKKPSGESSIGEESTYDAKKLKDKLKSREFNQELAELSDKVQGTPFKKKYVKTYFTVSNSIDAGRTPSAESVKNLASVLNEMKKAGVIK